MTNKAASSEHSYSALEQLMMLEKSLFCCHQVYGSIPDFLRKAHEKQMKEAYGVTE